MKLTARIRSASDGWLALEVIEMPGLEAAAKRFEDIPDAVRAAAAQSTGRPQTEFDVDIAL
ncbi:transcriptional regulator [Pseudarthrobacter sp. LMD1-1-1.1]|uniref:transcriptional regulator n=1 Tax=Pseudarthrobacter sp. LMD1-1-1.1 TaxID=3135242 RepID=UPI0034420009